MSDQAQRYLATLLARWRLCAMLSVLGGVAAGIYAFTTPKWYRARLTVVPAEINQKAGLLAELPALGMVGGAAPTDVQRIRAVLTSHSVADEVIKKFELQKLYGEAHIEHTRLALWSHCAASVDKKSGIVELACEDQSPERAMAITTEFGTVGNEVFKRISASSAREERRYLETQVSQAKKDVDKASLDLREFQETYRMVDLPEQAKAVISAMASIKGEILSKQLELTYLKSFSSAAESNVRQLQQHIDALQAKLRQLEDSPDKRTTGADAAEPNFFPGAMRVPDLRFQLEQLVREQKIKETLFFLMTQRYETARADEARDTSTFQILDYPTLPTYKSRPKRLGILVRGFFWGFAAACAWIALTSWRTRRRLKTT